MADIYPWIMVFLVAFVVTYLMVPVSRKIAFKIGAVDYPSERRMNTEVIPRCGGIALYVGLLAACLAMLIGVRFLGWEAMTFYAIQDVNYILLITGVTFIFIVGLVDDITQLPPITKFVGQIISASIVVVAGVSISRVGGIVGTGFINLGWLDYPISIIFLVAFMNIINLVDGLDGLAAGIVAIIALALLYMVLQRGNVLLAMLSLALVAVCLAFLRFNFAPASVFMGDSGAYLLGIIVGIIAIAGVVRTRGLIVSLVPVVIAGVPVLDTLSAIIRRLRSRRPIQENDMEHIHHRMVGGGLGQREAVLVLYLCSFTLAVIGILISGTSRTVSLVVLVALAVVLAIVVWRFDLFKPVLHHYYDGKGRRGLRQKQRSQSENDEKSGSGGVDPRGNIGESGDVDDANGNNSSGNGGDAGSSGGGASNDGSGGNANNSDSSNADNSGTNNEENSDTSA